MGLQIIINNLRYASETRNRDIEEAEDLAWIMNNEEWKIPNNSRNSNLSNFQYNRDVT